MRGAVQLKTSISAASMSEVIRAKSSSYDQGICSCL
jgi:hypothetical protein